jgi:hypothetical protein
LKEASERWRKRRGREKREAMKMERGQEEWRSGGKREGEKRCGVEEKSRLIS